VTRLLQFEAVSRRRRRSRMTSGRGLDSRGESSISEEADFTAVCIACRPPGMITSLSGAEGCVTLEMRYYKK